MNRSRGRYRDVVREQGIRSCDGAKVPNRLRNEKTGKVEQRTACGAHCFWVILQQVPPKGSGALATSAYCIEAAGA